MIEKSGSIETDTDYWDCECKTNYIHLKSKGRFCSKCKVHEEDGMPDSRVSEIKHHYDPSKDKCMNLSIYQKMIDAGVKVDSHYSDLYAEVNIASRAIVAEYEYKSSVTTFTSATDGKLWYDIPFAFQPYWDKVAKKSAKTKKST